LCPPKKKKRKKEVFLIFKGILILKNSSLLTGMEGLYFDQSGILVAKEMVGHANLVSLCLHNKVEFLSI
jgi:hypothetical protein